MTDEERLARLEQNRQIRKQKRLALRQHRVSVCCCALLLLCFAVLLVYFTAFPRSEISEIERRKLAAFPTFSVEDYFSGDYTAGISTFFTDTVPFRDTLTQLRGKIKSLFGISAAGEGDVIFLGNPNGQNIGGDDLAPKKTAAPTAKPAPTPVTTPAPGTEDPTATPPILPPGTVAAGAGRFGEAGELTATPEPPDFTHEDAEEETRLSSVFLVKQNGHYRAMEYYYGGGGSAYAAGLNALRAALPESVAIWSMPTPIAGEFYAPQSIWDAGMFVSNSDTFDAISEKFDPGINAVNVCPALAAHSGEDIYLRTDHHWQPLGAYYAAEAFAKAANVPFAPLSDYTKEVREGYLGTMYGWTDSNANLGADPDDFTYYIPSADYTAYYYDTAFNYLYSDSLFEETSLNNSYGMFLGGDDYVVKVKTGVQNGRKLVVVKDSYGNATIPFYTSSFEEIYVMDVRYFERNLVNFVKTVEATDVVFTMSAFSIVGANAESISDLVTQDANSAIVDEAPDAVAEREDRDDPEASGR